MTSLLIFAGSTRANSFNRQLAAVAAASARTQFPNATVTHIELADYDIPLYQADAESQGTPADVLKLKALMHAHAGWIVCSPEYNGSYTGLLKNTIDWCSSPAVAGKLHSAEAVAPWREGTKPFRGKVVGLMAASPGAMGGLRGLADASKLLLNLQCWLAPAQYALGGAGSAFDASGQLVDAKAQSRVDALVAQVANAAAALA